MPRTPHLIALLLALVLALPPAAAQPDAARPEQPEAQQPETQQPETQQPAPEPDAAPAPDAQPEPAFVARPQAEADRDFVPLAPDQGADRLTIEFSRLGAGIASLSLNGIYDTIKRKNHVILQQVAHSPDLSARIVPFALDKIVINDVPVSFAARDDLWRQDPADPGRFTAEVVDRDGRLVARVTRHFRIDPGSYEITIEQSLENLTDEPMTTVWTQTGPVDMRVPRSLYGGDKRRVRYGYLLAPERQGTSAAVTADSRLTPRVKILGKRNKATGGFPLTDHVWPAEWTSEAGHRLSWIAMTDRYFAVAVHPVLTDPENATTEDKLLTEGASVKRVVLNRFSQTNDADAPPTMVLSMTSTVRVAPPGGTADASIGVYAGPLNEPELAADPVAVALGLDDVVIYNFGSFCAFCTFSWLTHALLIVLRALHAITFDWAISIILLVIVVRTILHPITRWSQIRMQRFGVQMQAMAPKQKQLKEKYADDPKRLQQETAKLWREEGISPAGMLGCLPMFLQSPVWIALYATLYFVYDLRHEPAFYGVFQKISGGEWGFLADLASPDQAIPLPGFMHFSFWIWGSVTAINLLPIIMAFVFYAHQKYLTPPTTATLSPEQMQQQKMMKIMMIFMFPLFMYAAPSGLALYFVTNSTIAIFENRWIRAHMKKHDMLDPDKIREARKNKGGGFMQRLSDLAEAQQAAKEASKNPGGAGAPIRQYKKRK